MVVITLQTSLCYKQHYKILQVVKIQIVEAIPNGYLYKTILHLML